MGSAEGTDRTARTGEIMAAVDRSGVVPRYVIADISREGAWVAMPAETACSLPAWR